MSCISYIRLVNIEYNKRKDGQEDASYHIYNEHYPLNRLMTVFDLGNGHGKSVQVQFLKAVFAKTKKGRASKPNQGEKTRQFEEFFQKELVRPMYVMVEYAMDNSDIHVMVGLMLKKHHGSEDDRVLYDQIGFIHEYTKSCKYDIEHIPFYYQKASDNGRVFNDVKTWQESMKMFEAIQSDRANKFYYYNLNSPSEADKYYAKLPEYQIYREEWEEIMLKVNAVEGGLSKYFDDCKTQDDVIRNVFLDTVMDHIDPDKSKRNDLCKAIEAYTKEYNANKNAYDQAKSYESLIALLNDKALPAMDTLENVNKQIGEFSQSIINLYKSLQDEMAGIDSQIEHLRNDKNSLQSELLEIDNEKRSYAYYKAKDDEADAYNEWKNAEKERDSLEENKKMASYLCECFRAAEKRARLQELENDCSKKKEKFDVARKEEHEITTEIEKIEPLLYRKAETIYEQYDNKHKELEGEKLATQKKHGDVQSDKEKNEQARIDLIGTEKTYENKLGNYGMAEQEYNDKYNESLSRASNQSIYLNDDVFTQILTKENSSYEQLTGKRFKAEQRINVLTKAIEDNNGKQTTLNEEKIKISTKLETLEENDKINEQLLSVRQNIFAELEYTGDKFDMAYFDDYMRTIESGCENKIADAKKQVESNSQQINTLNNYLNGEIKLPSGIVDEMKAAGLKPQYALKWFKHRVPDRSKLIEIFKKNRIIPYALLMSSDDVKKLPNISTSYTSSIIPVITREDAENVISGNVCIDYKGNILLYTNFNHHIIDEAELRAKINELENKNIEISQMLEKVTELLADKRDKANVVRRQDLNEQSYLTTKQEIVTINQRLEYIGNELKALREETDGYKTQQDDEKRNLEEINKSIKDCEFKIADTQKLEQDYQAFLMNLDKYNKTLETRKNTENEIARLKAELSSLDRKIQLLSADMTDTREKRSEAKQAKDMYKPYPDENRVISDEEYTKLQARYNALTRQYKGEAADLEAEIKTLTTRIERETNDLNKFISNQKINVADLKDLIYTTDKDELYKADLIEADRLYNDSVRAHGAAEEKYKAKQKASEQADRKAPVKIPKENIMDIDFAKRQEKVEERIKSCDNEIAATDDWKKTITNCSNEIETYSGIQNERLHDTGEYVRIQIDKMENISECTTENIQKLNRAKLYYDGAKKELLKELQDAEENRFFNEECQKKLLILEDSIAGVKDNDTITNNRKHIIAQITVMQDLVDNTRAGMVRDKEDRQQRVDAIYHFLKEIDENLNHIDSNSAIEINGKSQKMLELKSPDWEKNSDLYKSKIACYLDDLIKDAIAVLRSGAENNVKTFNETIDRAMECGNIYDAIIGLKNVKLVIRKVEKELIIPCTWAEMKKQSGGESSLAAFIVIANLMSYSRRGVNDFMRENREWKVLVLDNPFAEMNSPHLLKPMRKIAEKLRIQLICYTAHNQSDIYSMFDNVIVQNLVHGSTNYLTIDLDESTRLERKDIAMDSTRLEVIGQETLQLN